MKIKKDTVQETLVLPLYGRSYCSKKYPKIFHDPLSEEVQRKIDYDFEALKLKEFQTVTWAVRQRMLNDRVKAYLEEHPYATVIDLGCGLATGFGAVDNGTCRWVNLDLPDTMELRNQLIPTGERETNIAADAFDVSWIDKLNIDVQKGVYIISGGLFYYFKPEKVKRLFLTLHERFPGGGICFDAESSYGVKKSNKIVEKNGNQGAKMYFSVDNAQEMFSSWSDFGAIHVDDKVAADIRAEKSIPLKVRMILNLGCKIGIMKFVEILL